MQRYDSRSTLTSFAMVVVAPLLSVLSSPAYSQETGPEVKVWTVEPDPTRGTMAAFSSKSGVVLAGATALASTGRNVIIPIDQVVRVEFEAKDAPRTRRAALVSRDLHGAVAPSGNARTGADDRMVFDLANGDWVVATPRVLANAQCSQMLGEFVGDQCSLTLGGGGELQIPLDSIVAIRAAAAALPEHANAVRAFLESESRDEDRVLLSNGDVLRGFIGRVDAMGLTVENGAGDEIVPYRVVIAAKFASVPPARPPEPHVRVHLSSGARLTCTSFEMDREKVVARYFEGDVDAIRPEDVVRLDMIGGRWQPLSSLRPLTYEHTPMLALNWEFRRDSNVLGGALRVGGESFETGLGVHSRSRLSFELKGQFLEFVTRFGLDDSAGPMADVDVSILVDGTTRFERTSVGIGKISDFVRLDVRKANRIELVVDFGKNGDIQDRFNWVEPGLIR